MTGTSVSTGRSRPVGQNGAVSSSPFPLVRRGRGYDPAEVDVFLRDARAAYDLDPSAEPILTSEDIRHASFGLVKRGYSTTHVDAALERLEDAFALRERERSLDTVGRRAWLAETRETAQVLLNRLSRPAGEKFTRSGRFTQGYRTSDVDVLAARLVAYFETGAAVDVDVVRTAVFRPQRGGYAEDQVDRVLDAVIDVMLAVR
jgi:DivIVA domain-containing protein